MNNIEQHSNNQNIWATTNKKSLTAIDSTPTTETAPLTFKISGYILKTLIGSWIRLNSCRAHVILPATYNWQIDSSNSHRRA